MDLFTYLLKSKGKNSYPHKSDLFAYLLASGYPSEKTATGEEIEIEAEKTRVLELTLDKESTQKTSILPSGYTQVDYITATNTQYIDTGVKLNPGLFYDITFKYASSASGSNLGIYGRYTADNSITAQYQFGTKISIIYGTAENRISHDLTTRLRDKHNIKIIDYKLYIDNEYITENTNAILGETEEPFYLFRQSSIYGQGNIYSCKLYNGNTLIRDFIPCYRNSDNEIGMYDLVNNVFYANEGTGVFTYGSVVTIPNPEYPQEVNVIKDSVTVSISNGVDTIDTTIELGDNEIVGIGTYKDELIVDKYGHCYLNKKTGKVVMDGTEDIDYYPEGNWTFRYIPTPSIIYNGTSNYNNVLCNYFKGKVAGSDLAITSYQGTISFRYDLYKTGSSNDFKTWLSTHNTKVYYVLAEPQLIDLNYTVDLSLFKGSNTITNSENANMTIKYY